MNVCLIGFAAAGKSTVGRLVARALGRQFVDLDDAIAAAVGEPVAVLVARDEAAFRVVEARVLGEVLLGDVVVATGAGAAAYGDNLARMRARGCVVELAVGLAQVRLRAVGGSRPLLQQSDDDVAALMRRRAPFYRGAHAVVATDGRRPEDVAATVREVVAAYMPDAVIVGIPGRVHPVVVRDAPIDGDLIRAGLDHPSYAVVVDGNVAKAWSRELQRGFPDAVATIVVPPGEASKSLAGLGTLCDQLIAAGLDRSSAVVAVGGGVTGDLAGLAAATLFRGIAIAHVPTTLVAMTDSSIGGKTAIDLAAGKNLLGAFWQPRVIAAHVPLLTTLPAHERRAGFGELWKYALLDGEATWAAVDAVAGWGTAADGMAAPAGMVDVIRRAAALKIGVVVRDERETGSERVLLNLGHTVGHAIESETGMSHGQAVGLGLVAACQVAAARGHAPSTLPALVADALARTGLPSDPRPYVTEPMLARLAVDKKRRGGALRFIMPCAVGRCEVVDLPVLELATILRSSDAL